VFVHIHLPLVFVVIFYSAIVLYWIIYKILLRKKTFTITSIFNC